MNDQPVVAKYGGTSMAQPAVVANIIKNHPEQKIIVCSAPGKTPISNEKITDLLYEHARLKAIDASDSSLVDHIITRFKEIVADLDDEFKKQFLENLRSDITNNFDKNFLVSRGEYYSAWALSQRIDAKFIDASELFVFDGSGELDRPSTDANIKSKLANETRFALPGFFGKDGGNNIKLFGRGGSDRSGAIIAASLGWTYQNWSDVDGIMNGDPKILAQAKVLSELTYEEVREGAHGGTAVLMGDSILDLEYGNCDTVLKNTFNPNSPGTKIVKLRQADQKQPVVALSARDDLLCLTIHDLGMRDRKGYMAAVLEILANNEISIEHMPTAQDSMTITFHNRPKLNPETIKNQVSKMLISPSASCVIKPCGVVYLVGEQLRQLKDQHSVVIAALQILEKNDVSVFAIMMHPDSPSLAVIIDQGQTLAAQTALFDAFLSK